MPFPWSLRRAVGVALILAPILALILALPSRATARTELERRLEELRAAGAAEEALALVDGSAAAERAAPAALARWRHRLLVELGRMAEAERAGHAWVAAAAAGDREDELEAALEVARFLARRGKRAEAADLLEQRLELAETAAPDRRLELWLELANSWTSSGRYVEAGSMLEAAVAAGREMELSTAQRMALLEAWGNLHFFRLEPKLALGYREEAARLALDGGRPADALRLYTDLGLTRIQLHDHGAAIADLERAANLIDEPTDGRRLPILHGLGVAALELHRLDDADRAFTEFTAEAERLGNRRLLSVGVGELGLVALERGDVEGAVAAFDVAIAHARAARDLGNEVAWWMNRGKARRDQGRFEEALASYREAEELVARLPGRVEAALFKHVGQCHAGLGDDVRALSSFARALEIAQRSGDRKVLWETQRELGRLHRRRGDPARAEASYLAALDALESLRSGLRIESFKTDFFQSKVQVYDEALELIAVRETDGAERSFEIAERARARAFLDTLALTSTDLHQTLPPALREQERRLLDRISALQAELRSGGKGGTGDRLAAAESESSASRSMPSW
ncbi:MAG TPA: tetratricopeptide repeat protein [Thermoanaerobaculia bacterium]|nr:tetratricopeptide repeat protein [Thermoanaerobaculia bacterium]